MAKLAGLPAVVVKRAEMILSKLEAQNTHTTTIVDDLPLFSAVLEKQEATQSKVEQTLSGLDIDSLSARDALNMLYDLKNMLH